MAGTRRRRWAVRASAATAVAVAAAGTAHGFYFLGWPGDSIPKAQNLVPSTAPKEGNPPSAQLREVTGTTSPSGSPPDTPVTPTESPPEQPPGRPPSVPEPATVVLAGFGAGLLALARWRRRVNVL